MIIFNSAEFKKGMSMKGIVPESPSLIDKMDQDMIDFLTHCIAYNGSLGIALEYLGLINPEQNPIKQQLNGIIGYSLYSSFTEADELPAFTRPTYFAVTSEDGSKVHSLSTREILDLLPDEYSEEEK